MPTSLLQSQFDTLEPLQPDELGAVIDVTPPLDEVVAACVAKLSER
jgi:gluconokinase